MFSDPLKPELNEAIQSGAIEYAIKVFSIEGPKITHDLRAELVEQCSGSSRRVSSKPRNTSHARSDTLERTILAKFDVHQAKSSTPPLLHFSEIVNNK